MALSKPVYQRESRRLATFNHYDGPKSILQLARNGFFWARDHDKITCYNCGFSLNNWNWVEDVVDSHKQYAPDCPVSNGNDRNNIPMRMISEDFEKQLLLSSKDSTDTSGSKYMKDGPRDTTDCTSETRQIPQFVITCRDIFSRAKRKGILGENNPPPVVKIDLNNPDFELLKDERVRLRTFTDGIWPQDANAKPEELARNGMFYTGMSDRVQCAFCRGFLRNWAVGDVVSDEHRRHFPDCPFVKGHDIGNVTVEERHRDAQYTMTSSRRSPSPGRNDVNFRRTAGRRSPSPLSHQASITPLAAGTDVDDSENVGITDVQRTFASLTVRYRVKHPQYSGRQARMQTFMNARGLLPRGQNIDTLVDAGFFHVGPHDNVKCFCCDIGLKNWQIDDNPWIEHARWFPRCSYLKEQKDEEFIQAAQANRNRWLQNNADDNGMPLPSLNVEPSNMSLLENTSMPPGLDVIGNDIHGAAPQPDELFGAPGARMRNQREVVAGMVYLDEPGARHANDQRRQRHNNDDDDEDDNVVEIDPEAQQLLEENRQLHEVRTCKVCMDKEVNIVFLPCGHLVCCDNCAPVLRTCAVCRSLIRGTVKIFLA